MNTNFCESCTPWDKKYWGKIKVANKMDPALYNVLNGCWLCYYDKQNMENDYIMDRSFFGIDIPKPCNRFTMLPLPKNSKDDL